METKEKARQRKHAVSAKYLYHPRSQLQLRIAHGYSEEYRSPLILSGSLGLRGHLLTVPHRDISPGLGTSLEV
jgi:hypothetical protein